MEADNLTQEVKPEQIIQNPSTEQAVKQKGYLLPILIAVIVLVTVGAGGYLIYKSQIKQPTPSQQTSQSIPSSIKTKNQYANTTLGFTLNLPDGWTVCDSTAGHGFVGVTPPPESTPNCSGSGPYTITISKYYYQASATSNPLVRQPGESFIDYVKQLDQTYFTIPGLPIRETQTQSEFKTIDSHTILETIPGASNGSPFKIMYIENPQVTSFIITVGAGANESDVSNLQVIASGLASSPITTGDITGQMSAQIEKDNTFYDTDTPTNFPITLYAEDKSTVVATTKTNFAGIYNFRVKPGVYYISDPGTGWRGIEVSIGDIQTFNGGTITHSTP